MRGELCSLRVIMTRAYIRIIVQHITCCAKVKELPKSKDVELETDSSGSSSVGDNPSEDFSKNL